MSPARFSDPKPASAECRVGRTATNFDDLQRMRTAAWQQQGHPAFDLDTITDPFTRQVIINEANRQYGRRAGGGTE